MPRISIAGIGGSGLDINSIVQQLVSVERRPLDAARREQTGITAKLSSFASLRVSLAGLKASLAPLKSFSTYESRTVSSSDSNVLTATVTSSATLGAYTVNQVEQRARGHKLQSNNLSSDTAVIGSGTLKIKVGDGPQKVISISEKQRTLVEIRDQINTAKAGIDASILKVNETDFRLMLETRKTGKKNAIEVEVIDGDGNNSDTNGLSLLRYTPSLPTPDNVQNLSEIQAAQDARVKIDGVPFTRSTNTITDALPGVTLTLLKETGPDANIAVNVFSSSTGVRGKIESFVSSYNRVVEEINRAQAFDKGTQQGGPLLGNETARTILSRLQSLARSRVSGLESGAYSSIVDIGLTTEKDGTLKIDSAKLDAALAKDTLAVGRVFAFVDSKVDPTVSTATSGMADLMDKAISELITTDKGDIALQEKGLRKTIATIEERVIRLERGADSFEKKTRERFAKLEAVLAGITGTGAVLDRQIAQLESLFGGGRRNRRGGSSPLSGR